MLTIFRGLDNTNGGVRGNVGLFKVEVYKMVTFPSPIEYNIGLPTLRLGQSTNVNE